MEGGQEDEAVLRFPSKSYACTVPVLSGGWGKIGKSIQENIIISCWNGDVINKHLKMGAQKGNLTWVTGWLGFFSGYFGSRPTVPEMDGLLRFMIMMANVVVFLWCGTATTMPESKEGAFYFTYAASAAAAPPPPSPERDSDRRRMRWNETHHDRHPLG